MTGRSGADDSVHAGPHVGKTVPIAVERQLAGEGGVAEFQTTFTASVRTGVTQKK
jgi:hypothetical protein